MNIHFFFLLKDFSQCFAQKWNVECGSTSPLDVEWIKGKIDQFSSIPEYECVHKNSILMCTKTLLTL